MIARIFVRAGSSRLARRRTARLALAGLLVVAATVIAHAQSPSATPSATPVPLVGNPHGDMALDCRLCHSEQDWSTAAKDNAFDHSSTGFALDGLHAKVACKDCHKHPQFSHVGTQCADCHLDAHKGRLGPACSQCHMPAGWVDRPQARRDHDQTRLPLVGAHASVDCDACHVGAVRGEYVGTPHACYACHQADYEATGDPDHVQAGFGTDCEQCHGVFSASWGRGDFIHSPRFPLTGAHAATACAACHSDGFAGTPTDCYACHQADYDGAANPPHPTAGLGTDCATCHGTTDWRPSTYDHAATGYTLEGSHRAADCLSCHQAGFANTPTDCYACHRTDYEGAADPNHVSAGFPTDCATCHAVTTWNDSNFDHARTSFPLTGAHASQACAACHASGYTGTPTDCFACHQADYAGTTDPNHTTAGIPTTCATCHSTTAWEPASFNHSLTSFPLTGAHATQTCVACHASGYTGTPTDCYACHQADYTQTNDPSHSAAAFPTTCATCHSTTAWTPSSWNHEPLFPIASGRHSNLACTECHVTPSNYAHFECILCHEHNQSNAANDHQDRPDYQWVSTACYACHPRGN